MPEVNDICQDCMIWEKFGRECWVHWELKKECTHRIITSEEKEQTEKNIQGFARKPVL